MQSKKTVQLRPLSMIGLSLAYARKLSDTKIIHYKVSGIGAIISNMTGKDDTISLIRKHIEKTEGPIDGIEMLEPINQANVSKNGPNLSATDMTDRVLEGKSKVQKSLLKLKTSSLIHQYAETFTLAEARKWKWTLLQKARLMLYSALYHAGLGRLIPAKHEYITFQRKIAFVSYLSVAYDETDEQKAVEMLRRDLSILDGQGLIMGHLCMPASIYLADTVGSGVPRKVLFCFPIVNQNKLCDQFNKDQLKISQTPLKGLLGLQTEAMEGKIGIMLNQNKYEIEEVNIDQQPESNGNGSAVFGPNHDAEVKSVIENYKENTPIVNAIAAKLNAAIKAGNK